MNIYKNLGTKNEKLSEFTTCCVEDDVISMKRYLEANIDENISQDLALNIAYLFFSWTKK